MDHENHPEETTPDLANLFVRISPDAKNRLDMASEREGVSRRVLMERLLTDAFTPTGRRRTSRTVGA